MSMAASARRTVQEYRNTLDCTAETLELAEAKFASALRTIATKTPLLHVILSLTDHVPTTKVETLAVQLRSDGLKFLVYNPNFIVDYDEQGAAFFLAHEAEHLLALHLERAADKPELLSDQYWIIATEAMNNHFVKELLGAPGLPRNLKTGEESGVNPTKVFQQYQRNLKAAGLEPVTEKVFLSTDDTCRSELARMTRDPSARSAVCTHLSNPGNQSGSKNSQSNTDGDNDSSSENLEGGLTISSDVLEDLIVDAIQQTAHEARVNGNAQAVNELTKRMERAEGSEEATKIWGTHAAGVRVGDPVVIRTVSYWEQYVTNKIASMIQPDEKLTQLKKLVAIEPQPPFRFRGESLKHRGVICYDTSGSMGVQLLNRLKQLIGDEDGLEIDWVTCDTQVYRINPNEPLRGGGGTVFEPLVDYVEGRIGLENEPPLAYEPDFVIVVTDGEFNPIHPQHPENWVWLITPGGTDWPRDYGMDSIVLTRDDIAVLM